LRAEYSCCSSLTFVLSWLASDASSETAELRPETVELRALRLFPRPVTVLLTALTFDKSHSDSSLTFVLSWLASDASSETAELRPETVELRALRLFPRPVTVLLTALTFDKSHSDSSLTFVLSWLASDASSETAELRPETVELRAA